MLDDATFRTVVASTPLVSIDLVVRREDGHVLLGLRNNRPAQGFWFVPGGRVRKNETLDSAFLRLTLNELGFEVQRRQAHFLGVYEHLYEDSVFGSKLEAPSTHYVVLGYQLDVSEQLEDTLPLEQHTDYRWLEQQAILEADDVHENTKAYFRKR